MGHTRLRHVGVAALLAGVCVAFPGGATAFASSTAPAGPYQVAWAMVLQNSYTQAMLQGAEAVAKTDNVKITTFDTGFTAQKQFSVIQDIVALHKYQGILVQPNDSVGIEPAIKQAIKAGIQVVTLNVPIGPNATTIEPQLPGLAGSVLTPQVTWGHQLGEMTENACKGINPCRVAYIAGEIGTSGDDNMLAGFKAQVKGQGNIDVVAIQNGGDFLIGPAEDVAKNLLVAHPNLNVILSTGDQMTHGAQLAVQVEGLSGKVKLIGLGASTYALSAIKAGTWYGSVVTLPLSIGRIGMQVLFEHLKNPKLAPSAVDPAVYTKQNPLITKGDIGTFQAQWSG
ncbi:MAG TPA: sugar ABC transporter substrate-binding protein [Acidimicrobiales bacterium]|nr:sugar ABC transporter substrate-binding protein [Acidimicrobiales bacterium]